MKKLLRWIIIALILQVLTFSYIEFIYIPNRGAVSVSSFINSDDSIRDKKVKLSSNMKGITISSNGFYLACRQGEKLVIVDLRNGRRIKSLSVEKGSFTYYRWLPDRDMLIYSIKEPDGEAGQVEISTFDLAQKIKRSYPKITGLPKNSEIKDIELSPLTNVVYSIIKTSESRVRVYKFNIMDELDLIMKTGVKAVFKKAMYSDLLVYQEEGERIVIRNGITGKTSYIAIKGKLKLLSIDGEDNIYAGTINNEGQITKIHYGQESEKGDRWNEITLNSPISISNVYITMDGSIYIKSEDGNSIRDLKNKTTVNYNGELHGILDNYVVTIDKNRLKLTVIK